MREYLSIFQNREQFAKVLSGRARVPGRVEVLYETEVSDLAILLGAPRAADQSDPVLLATADWYLANVEHPWWRLFAAASFVVGFGFLSVPALDTLLGVFKDSVRIAASIFQ